MHDGAPVTGKRNIIFRIWDASTGGSKLWEESRTGDDIVSVANGLFNVKLGGVTSLPETVFTNAFTYLEIEVEGTILGRERLVTVPYAYHSAMADTLTGDLSVPRVYTNYMRVDGNVDVWNGLNVLQDSYLNRAYVNDFIRVPKLTSPAGRIDIDGAKFYDGTYLYLSQDAGGNGLITTSGHTLIINTHENLSRGIGGWVSIGSFNVPLSPEVSLFVNGNFVVAELFSKSAVVNTINHGQRLLYSREGAEVKFIDEGKGQLINGTVNILLEPIFKETIETENYLVQITPLGECNGLYVSEQTPDYFTVKELKNGTSNIKFVWQISGYSKIHRGKRLEEFKSPTQK